MRCQQCGDIIVTPVGAVRDVISGDSPAPSGGMETPVWVGPLHMEGRTYKPTHTHTTLHRKPACHKEDSIQNIFLAYYSYMWKELP